MTNKARFLLIAVTAVFCLTLLFASSTCTDRAAADAPFTLAEVRLARLVVHEAGFAATNDPRAIAHVVRNRARVLGLDIADYVATFHAQATFGPTRRRWVNALDAGLDEPAGWPVGVPWSRYRLRWYQRLREVRTALAEPRNRCRAYTWGAPRYIRARMDRMIASGWTRVDCGRTLNEYLQAPAR